VGCRSRSGCAPHPFTARCHQLTATLGTRRRPAGPRGQRASHVPARQSETNSRRWRGAHPDHTRVDRSVQLRRVADPAARVRLAMADLRWPTRRRIGLWRGYRGRVGAIAGTCPTRTNADRSYRSDQFLRPLHWTLRSVPSNTLDRSIQPRRLRRPTVRVAPSDLASAGRAPPPGGSTPPPRSPGLSTPPGRRCVPLATPLRSVPRR
jgi:hypothetical protein